MKLRIIRDYIKARLLVFAVALAVGVVALAVPVIDSVAVNAQDKFVVSIFDRGKEKSFATDAQDVSQALERAGIKIGTGDIVEPDLRTPINSDSFNINIYRARSVTVVDGDTERTIATAYRSPEAIAKAAGFTVFPEDEYSFERITDFVDNPVIGLKLHIYRATPVNFMLYGSKIDAHTQLNTVADFLAEQGVEPGANDLVRPAPDSEIVPGIEVSVTRISTDTITVEEAVDYQREIILDTSMPFGYEDIETPGVAGKARVTYEVVYHDGVESARNKIQSVTIEEPQKEVVVRGAKPSLVSGGREQWLRAVGIPESEWQYVDFIIGHEAGWEGVTKWNYAGSGAYGICQALPANKMASAGDDWATNGATQLKWCDSYAKTRYGSWEAAYNFWQTHYWW